MNFKRLVWTLIVLPIVFYSSIAFAQTSSDPVIEQIMEDMSEDLPEDFDFSDLVERLSFYQKNPVEVNRITRDQLQELFFLSPLQINAFLEHRVQTGKLLDLLELQSVEGFDSLSIRRLSSFVYIGLPNTLQSISLRNLYQKGSNDLMVRYSQYIQKQRGYETSSNSDESAYSGTPQKLFLRYRYNYGRNISASINLEKDAGEQFFPGKSIGFDFSSANIYVRDIGLVKKVVLGDYSLQFGQALALWSGLSFGKGAMIANLAKPEMGLQPYKSVNEVLFFRGIASSFNFKSVQLTPFLSVKQIDGHLEKVGNTVPEISSMSQSGLHRTATEFGNKNEVLQTVYGANLRFIKSQLNAGITGYQTKFSHPVQSGQLLYNKFKFSGTSLTNLAINYAYTFKNTYLFGEAAYSGSTGGDRIAYINGLMSSLSSRVSMVVLHRYYPVDYYSFFNQAISESSNAINENGLYAGLIVQPSAKWDVSVYSDYFRFPWLKFGVDAPSHGYELFGQISYQPNKKTRWAIRYKAEQKQDNDDVDETLNAIVDVRKQSYRIEFNSKVNRLFSLRNRLEISDYQKPIGKRERGWMIYQDVIFDPMSSHLSGNLRVALFKTPGFNSRIYAFENDVLYAYSMSAYQNHGLRFYMNGRYSFTRKMDMWIRYSISKYNDIDKIGSGLDQIDGSHRSEVKLQIRYQY